MSIPPLVPRHAVAAVVHEVYEHTATVGDSVGLIVGNAIGLIVGNVTGATVGNVIGLTVGSAIGSFVGEPGAVQVGL